LNIVYSTGEKWTGELHTGIKNAASALLKETRGGVAFVHIRCVVDDSVDALPIGTRIAFDERPPKGAEDKP
jgi:hypothetical protein